MKNPTFTPFSLLLVLFVGGCALPASLPVEQPRGEAATPSTQKASRASELNASGSSATNAESASETRRAAEAQAQARRDKEDRLAVERQREAAARVAAREEAREAAARQAKERETAARRAVEVAEAEREKIAVEAKRLDDEVNDCFEPNPQCVTHSAAAAGVGSSCPDCLQVTIKNTGPRIVAEVCIYSASGTSADCAKERIGFGATAVRQGGEAGATRYKVRYVGSKIPANDWECVSWLGLSGG